MRRLSFGTEQVDKDRFDILYAGLCVSPRGVNRTELVTFNRLLSKLESVGKSIPIADPRFPVGYELGEGGVVKLEEPEFALLNEFHNTVKWSVVASKKAEEAYTWLDSIKEETLEVVK